jgi:phage terminase small subunit
MPRRSAADAAFSTTTTQRLKPPPDLTGAPRELFLSLVLSLPAHHFTPSDLPLLTAYVRAVVMEQSASAKLSDNPVDDDTPSPWLRVWQANIRAVTPLARSLRLTPLSRREEAKPSTEERMSYYERQALEQRTDETDTH